VRGDFAETRRVLMERDDEVRMRRSAVACCAAALTLLLHALLISPLLWGGGRVARKPMLEEGGATSGVPAMTLAMLEDTDNRLEAERQPFEKLSALVSPARVLVPAGTLHLADNVTQPAIEEPKSAPSESQPPTDDGERASMFGRYLGQVTARIERAWLRPRSPIGSSSFTCLVQIEQDKERNVGEVTLKACNGTTAWQLSLVHAIESASPFPAPPDPAVFSKTLIFEMVSDAFVEGGSTDGFAPDASVVSR
jgi:hypothetical protein